MLKQITEWKSVRKFTNQPVEEEKLLSIMSAGRRAPSWKNIQPWRFIGITGEEDKTKLAEGFSIGALIRKAPAVILCVGTLAAWERNHQRDCLRDLLSNTGVTMSNEDIDKTFLNNQIAQALANTSSSLMARTFENMGIAYGFMILEATNQGLGACIVGEIDNELSSVNSSQYSEIKSYFNLNTSEIITAAIILGYPSKNFVVSPRKPEGNIFQIWR
jgi:nitroreductase